MVSVFLLSWNHKVFIEQAINSILIQSYKELEIIYVDNNSSDQSFEVADAMLKTSSIPSFLFKRDKNYSIPANLNFMLSKCHGDFICLLSADDWLHRDNILLKMKKFDDPMVALVYSGGYKYYDEIGVYEPFKVISFPDEEVLQQLLNRNFISAVGGLLKKKAVLNVGGWNEKFSIEDGDMWVKIVSKYKIIGIDKFLFFYRQHLNAISRDPEYMLRAKMEWLNSNITLNKIPEITYRNNIDNYLAGKVMQRFSFKTILSVLHHFRFNKRYFVLLIKSFLPLRWKTAYFKRSLLKQYGNNAPGQ